nr:uncharacterized protein LOC129449864 [Misgurnus anguillicaudatus]
MKHLFLMCLLFYINIHTTQSIIFNRRVTVGKDVFLVCNHKGNVTWSKARDGTRVDILTAEKDEETKKLISDPHNRYSLLDDLSLYIERVSLSDSGIYSCNETPTVNLIVTEPDSNTSNDRQPGATTPTPETTTSYYSQPGATTPTPDSIQRFPILNLSETLETTTSSQPGATTPTGFSHSQPKGTTPQDSSAKKSFKSFCIKEIK